MPFKDRNKQLEYQRQWIAGRRAKFFEGKSCVVCGSTEQLELDHIDPATKVSHRIWSLAEARRLEEIAKCQVLCRKCHIDKTSAENQRPLIHGNSGYDRGCRCSICFSAHSARMKLRVR